MTYLYSRKFNQGMDIIETDPGRAVEIFEEIIAQAINDDNLDWRLTAEHWRLQAYISYKRDYLTANRLAIAAAIESRKPEYRDVYEYICLQYDLILVYDGIDPVGYAPEIKEAIDFTLKDLNSGRSCYFCLNRRLVEYYRHIGEEAQARDQAARFFAMTHSNRHYRVRAYTYLAYFYRQDKAWEDLLKLCQTAYELANENDDIKLAIEFKSYELLALQMLQRQSDAEAAFNLINLRRAGIKLVLGDEYYDNLAAYYEAQGALELALREREQHLETFVNAGRIYWECIARLDQIRLLRLLGRAVQAETLAVQQLAQKLKQPELIIARLEA